MRFIFIIIGFLCLPALQGHAYGATIEVIDFKELNDALQNAESGDVILLGNGTYQISGQFALVPGSDNITIRSKSGAREMVIVRGQGMYGGVDHGFWVNRNNIAIQDITIEQVANHCIQLDTNVDGFHLKNCILRDGYEQLLKVPYSSAISDPSENGIVEQCLFEYTAGEAPNWYTGGIDVHFGKDWIVRDNTFRDIQSPSSDLSEHAVHFWTDSQGTLVERNIIINCDRGIGFGLGSSRHVGGIIRNNMIYHDGSGTFADVGIGIESSSDTQIYNNSIYLNHDRYSNAIEYRFSETQGAYIANNLTNKSIVSRNNGTAVLESNLTDARPEWFVDPTTGDLHLAYRVVEVVDRGTAITGLTSDFDGDSRPQGGGIDIGADEFVSGGVYDFNGDGLVDVLYRHPDTGNIGVWFMNKTIETSWARISNPDGDPAGHGTAWDIEGVGDFNGDGANDILYVHSGGNIGVWLMNGVSETIWQPVVDKDDRRPANHGTWDIKGAADFNGDGRVDVLYRHPETGNIGIWFMKGASETSWTLIDNPDGAPTNHGVAWDIKGVGDFNGDSQNDILYRHSNGNIGVWLMNGAVETAWQPLIDTDGHRPANHGTWNIKCVADYNGDGNVDVLYRHPETGNIGVWLMNGALETAWEYINNHGPWDIR